LFYHIKPLSNSTWTITNLYYSYAPNSPRITMAIISLRDDNQIIPQLLSNQSSSYFTFSYADEMHQHDFDSSVML